ncbi:MAG: prepilin peptidase [Saccharofermentans sp.]|nr:prepilin peptidase [Saccharofermentans sp.]
MNSVTLFLYCFFIVDATLFGIIIGSFLNVVIYRIPEGRTIVKGHSMCMTCGHTLAAKDLVPLFSWLFLKGKCRYCGAPVPSRYAKIESFTGLVFLISALSHLETAFFLVDPDAFLSIFASFVLFVLACCAAISAMMIYHDTGKGYLQLALISIISGILATAICLYKNNADVNYWLLSLLVVIAGVVVFVILMKVIFVFFKKTYSKADTMADLTIAGLLFNREFTILVTKLGYLKTSCIEIILFGIVYGVIRASLKNTKKEKISVILGFLVIVILVILRYSYMKIIYNF